MGAFIALGLLCAAPELLYQGRLLRPAEAAASLLVGVALAVLPALVARSLRSGSGSSSSAGRALLGSLLYGLAVGAPLAMGLLPLLWSPRYAAAGGVLGFALAAWQHHSEGDAGAPLPAPVVGALLLVGLVVHHQWRAALTLQGLAVCGVGIVLAAGLAHLPRLRPGLAPLLLLAWWLPPDQAREAGGHAADAPDIIVISVDTLRADVGHEMQTAQRLAAAGVRFDQASSSSSWTLPSMASAFTGHASNQHGAGLHDYGLRGIPDELPLLAERLAEAGYDTASVLADNPYVGPSFGFERGFASRDDPYFAHPGWSLRQLVQTRRPADDLVSQALRVALQPREAPLFLWLHLLDCHLPYPQSELPEDERLNLRRYDVIRELERWAQPTQTAVLWDAYRAEVDHVDRALLRLLDRLPPTPGERIVLLTSDHGEEFFEHGGFEHGHSFFQEVAHIPLVIGGVEPAGRVDARPAGLVDVTPTLLALAGLPAADVAGRDLLTPAPSDPAYVIENHLYPSEALFAVRRGDWKAISGSTQRLFDLAADPGEQTNLMSDAPERFYELIELRPESRRWDSAIPQLSAEERAQLEALGYVIGD